MYVARFTTHPEYDAQRKWVGWIGTTSQTQRGCASLIVDYVEHPKYLWVDGEKIDWYDLDEETQIDWIVEYVDIRQHEPSGLWMHVHHPDGLSCWRLESETIEDAIAEAQSLAESGEIDWCGFGDVTRGNVRYVASVTDTLHIFECDDVKCEDW